MARLSVAGYCSGGNRGGLVRISSLGLWVTLACLFVARPAHGQSALSAEERALASYVDQHNDAGLELLKRVVNVNSGTENLAGVRQVGAMFRAEFDALGF